MRDTGTFRVKAGLAEMLKGGVIMDVVTADQARIAENAGAAAVMALERVPADIRSAGGVARMADPTKIQEIQEAVTIPVMAKARIGHFVEAQVLKAMEEAELPSAAKELRAPLELVQDVAERGRLPVVLFCAGGIATPADAALMMQLGAEGNFVGSGIFKSSDPARRARAIVEATTHYDDPGRVAAASRELGEAMPGIEIGTLQADGGLLQKRGW